MLSCSKVAPCSRYLPGGALSGGRGSWAWLTRAAAPQGRGQGSVGAVAKRSLPGATAGAGRAAGALRRHLGPGIQYREDGNTKEEHSGANSSRQFIFLLPSAWPLSSIETLSSLQFLNCETSHSAGCLNPEEAQLHNYSGCSVIIKNLKEHSLGIMASFCQ